MVGTDQGEPEPALRQRPGRAGVHPVGRGADGVVGVTYYDFRNDDGTGELADHWLVSCSSSCSDPASWESNEVRLTDTSFDYAFAPVTGAGLFLGDYVGLASDGPDLVSFFQQSLEADPANGYVRRITP